MLPISRLSTPYWSTRWLHMRSVSRLCTSRLTAEGALRGILRTFIVLADQTPFLGKGRIGNLYTWPGSGPGSRSRRSCCTRCR